MNLYRASELKRFLAEKEISARKGLSQNFLVDGNILKKIVRTAHLQPGDPILEIGPGPGALTEQLLLQGAHVTAIEIDPILAQALPRLSPGAGALTVLQQDFLQFPLAEFLSAHPHNIPWKVVANTPYHITTPILLKLFPLYPQISSVTLMVQKEFAKRLVAAHHTPDYGHLSLLCRFYSTPTYCFTVEPTCFYPPPKVQSAIVQLLLHSPPPVASEERFFHLTRTAFQKRRKMLRSSLRELFSPAQVEGVLCSLGLKIETRPEELSLEQFLQLFAMLDTQR